MRVLTVLSLVIPIILQVCILALLLRRRLQRRFIWFFVYVLYAVLELIVRLALSGNQEVYFKVYWSTEPVDVALTVLALRESFLSIFLPETSLRWFRWVFWSGMALAVAYGVFEAWALPPRQAGRLVTVIIDLEFVLNAVIFIFGLLYCGSIKVFGILEHQREGAIIFGFTANACLTTLGVLTRSAFGTRFRLLSESIPAVAYILAEAIWIRDLLHDEWKLPQPTQTLEEMRATMVKSIAILHKYLGREPR
jgi:hypothetical protein